MAIHTNLQYAEAEDLYLDPSNPRLGRENVEKRLSQEDILRLMQDWTLDELAISFLQSGFWPQEALMVVSETIGNQKRLVVVEGNRRLAALKSLFKCRDGHPPSKAWAELAKSVKPATFKSLQRVPHLIADSRKDVQAYLGFRHVTGIKQWEPAEKAEFIANLIDQGLTYEEVRRQIGSTTPVVRQSYISYRLLLQMEDTDGIEIEKVESKFSVLYLSLRTHGVQTYLEIDIQAGPVKAKHPVPKAKLEHLKKFALWLFGDSKREPVVSDSRLVDKFGAVLENASARAYLERSENPKFETAYRIAGGDESETIELIEAAADNVEQALGTAHRHTSSRRLAAAVERLSVDALELLAKFPDLRERLLSERC